MLVDEGGGDEEAALVGRRVPTLVGIGRQSAGALGSKAVGLAIRRGDQKAIRGGDQTAIRKVIRGHQGVIRVAAYGVAELSQCSKTSRGAWRTCRRWSSEGDQEAIRS